MKDKTTKEQERTDWFESVVNSLGKALFTTDKQAKVTFANELACSLTDKALEDLIGQPLEKVVALYSSADRSPVSVPVREAILKQKLFQSEQSLFYITPRGDELLATYSVSPLRREANGTEGSVVVICTYENEPAIEGASFGSHLFEADPEQRALRNQAFYTKKEGQFVRVLIDEILWIEAMENYVQLVTEEDRFLVHTTMKRLMERLEKQGFTRVHRSYIVPVDRVDAIEENRLYVGEKEIPIGKSYRQDLLQSLTFI